jgi:membrane protein DedA with SNARE-associated domain
MGRMNLVRFSIYTIIGAGLWNAFLTVCGFYLRKNWELVMQYSRIVDIAVLAILVFGIAFFIKKYVSRR